MSKEISKKTLSNKRMTSATPLLTTAVRQQARLKFRMTWQQVQEEFLRCRTQHTFVSAGIATSGDFAVELADATVLIFLDDRLTSVITKAGATLSIL